MGIKRYIEKSKLNIEDRIRKWCGELTPDKRFIIVVSILVIFASLNIYFTFTSIYNLGKENKNGRIEIRHISPSELVDKKRSNQINTIQYNLKLNQDSIYEPTQSK